MNEVKFVRDAAAKLLAQGKYSYSEGGCNYREDSTATCPVRGAFGFFIPDELYHSGLERTSAFSVMTNNPSIRAAVAAAYGMPEDLDFFRVVQRQLHDVRVKSENHESSPMLTPDEAVAQVERTLGRKLKGEVACQEKSFSRGCVVRGGSGNSTRTAKSDVWMTKLRVLCLQ